MFMGAAGFDKTGRLAHCQQGHAKGIDLKVKSFSQQVV